MNTEQFICSSENYHVKGQKRGLKKMSVDLQVLNCKTGTKRVKPALQAGLTCKSIKSGISEGGKTSRTRTGKHEGHVYTAVTVTCDERKRKISICKYLKNI
ncbi:MAG: hypothetical protein ACD_79C00868G0002 [uncultured bacterium]|nr:MAG: hypothetical protein ACD_79C00868G0002 [uncultured bacterium]